MVSFLTKEKRLIEATSQLVGLGLLIPFQMFFAYVAPTFALKFFMSIKINHERCRFHGPPRVFPSGQYFTAGSH